MNLLIDELPKSVVVSGKEYEIRTDFRISILYELLMHDENLTFDEKCTTALNLYYYEPVEDAEAALEAVFWFYGGGQKDSFTENRSSGNLKQVYSFEHDDQYIYAAFMEQYGIDLNIIPYLHWWKFSALFQSLSEKCRFSKIMGYRAMEIPSDMPQKQKEFYREMQELYRLPMPEKERETLNAIEEALLNGGDLTGVL